MKYYLYLLICKHLNVIRFILIFIIYTVFSINSTQQFVYCSAKTLINDTIEDNKEQGMLNVNVALLLFAASIIFWLYFNNHFIMPESVNNVIYENWNSAVENKASDNDVIKIGPIKEIVTVANFNIKINELYQSYIYFLRDYMVPGPTGAVPTFITFDQWCAHHFINNPGKLTELQLLGLFKNFNIVDGHTLYVDGQPFYTINK